MPVTATLTELSIDALLTELRARETKQKYLAAGKRAAADAVKSNDALREWDSKAIAKALKDKQKVIYGTDDRQDLFQVTDQAILNDADSVVALFDAGDVTDNGNGTSTLQTTSFSVDKNLCAGEPFASQPVGAFCSGFLVASDVIATAGHCVNTNNVTNVRFVFGFRMTNASSAQTVINNTEIYRGVSIIGSQLTGNGPDWTLVRIDRQVPNHKIAQVRTTGKIGDSQLVHIIGHPSGLPTKFAGGAAVRDNQPSAFFVANLDSYGGNSGSPVFNSNDHMVEGILVRGENDFVSNGSCNVSLVCPTTGCRGEDVTRTTEFQQLIPLVRSPRVPPKSQIGAVSRSADKLDIFVTDEDGMIRTAAWEPDGTNWRGWWKINDGQSAAGAPVHGVSRSANKLDVFVVGTDGRVFTAAWEPADADSWRGWWEIAGGTAPRGAHITVVSRAANKLDVFLVADDNRVWTAAWEPDGTNWRGWWPIGDVRVPAGAPVHAVSRGANKLDIFVTDVNGMVQTAAWEPGDTNWRGWWKINDGQAAPGAPVTAVSRNTDKLDVFVVGGDNRVWTAAWEPDGTNWRGWWPIGDVRAPAGSPVHAVSRGANKLDIFVTDVNGMIQTAAWEPGDANWRGWWKINDGQAAPGAPVTAVSRNTDKLDVFVVGVDNRVWTAAWEPGDTNWRGWWPIGI